MAEHDRAEPRRESPVVAVAGLPWQSEEVTVEQRPFGGFLNLRGNPGDPAFLDATAGVVGALPLESNTTAGAGDTLTLWLGPDEWLLVFPSEAAAAAAKLRLDEALAGVFHAVADLSSAQTVLRLSGERALDVIRSGVTLDVHPRVFGPGQCAQTNFSHAVVVLCPVDATPIIDVIVRRSFADYLARWIMDWAG